MPDRPNILFLQSDHQRHDALGVVDPKIQTPNLDKVARRGVRFAQAVNNCPMCVPSRYSMMSGLYPSQLGVRHNRQIICRDEDLPLPVLAERLREAGYHTGGFGKTHWYLSPHHGVPNQIDGTTRGFEVRAFAGHCIERMNEGPPEKVAYLGVEDPDRLRRILEERQAGGPGGETAPGYLGGVSAFPASEHRETWTTDKALAFLEAAQGGAKPWFCYLSFDAPHPGFFVPAEYEALYDPADFGDAPFSEVVAEGHRIGWREEEWAALGPDERAMARLRFFAYCSYLDAQFGRVLDWLEETGEAENTVVIMTSDHGDMLGERGRITKYCLYEGSIRVPLLMAGPGAPQGKVDERPAELVDVMPTLLDVAGEEIPPSLPGLSLLGETKREGSFAEMHGQGYEQIQEGPAYMWRTREWKLVLYLPGQLQHAPGNLWTTRGELYHLAEDPYEAKNLYDDPAHLGTREAMTRDLLMHLACAWAKYPMGDTPVTLQG
jgi:arylsulfatase A-like enzyme